MSARLRRMLANYTLPVGARRQICTASDLTETKYLDLAYRQNALFSILYIWGSGVPNGPDPMSTYVSDSPTTGPFQEGAF